MPSLVTSFVAHKLQADDVLAHEASKAKRSDLLSLTQQESWLHVPGSYTHWKSRMKSCNSLISILSVLASVALVHSFAPLASTHCNVARATSMPMTEETAAEASVDTVTDSLTIPKSFDEMVRMASSAMSDGYEAGISRQIMRVLLPRDPSNEKIGLFFENDADVDTQNLVLFPIDESWQGGIMQLYRAAQPTVEAILRYVRTLDARRQT